MVILKQKVMISVSSFSGFDHLRGWDSPSRQSPPIAPFYFSMTCWYWALHRKLSRHSWIMRIPFRIDFLHGGTSTGTRKHISHSLQLNIHQTLEIRQFSQFIAALKHKLKSYFQDWFQALLLSMSSGYTARFLDFGEWWTWWYVLLSRVPRFTRKVVLTCPYWDP